MPECIVGGVALDYTSKLDDRSGKIIPYGGAPSLGSLCWKMRAYVGLTNARSFASSNPNTFRGPFTAIGRLMRLASSAMSLMACALVGACCLNPWARYEAERVFKNSLMSALPINACNSASFSGCLPRSRSCN
jgi:hypothetical protein